MYSKEVEEDEEDEEVEEVVETAYLGEEEEVVERFRVGKGKCGEGRRKEKRRHQSQQSKKIK